MPSIATKTAEETSGANREAFRGGVVGAAKVCHQLPPSSQLTTVSEIGQWGLIASTLALAGYALSPIYRNLTTQFKIYIQFSAMTLGGMVEADRRLRAFEFQQVKEKRKRRQMEVWDRYEGLVHEEGDSQKEAKEEDGNAEAKRRSE